MLVLSVLFHLAIFSVVLFVPEAMPTRRFEGVAVYEVNLIEMPAGADKTHKDTKSTVEKKGKSVLNRDKRAKRIPESKKEKRPLVIAKRSVESKKSTAKKPDVSPSELIDRAISRIEKEAKSEKEAREKEESHLEQAITKLKGELAGAQGPGTTGGGPVNGLPIQIYLMEVDNRIKGNWSYPVALLSGKDLKAIVVIMVKRDGTILKTEMKRRSGDPIFDESVIKAVQRSDPLPPFPEGYKKSYEEFEIAFNPKDLEGH